MSHQDLLPIFRDSTVQINEGDITGSLVDGVMHCNFRVNSTYLPAEEKTLFHGMGKLTANIAPLL